MEENSVDKDSSDKNKKIMMLIIGLLVALIIIVIVVAIFIVRSLNSDSSTVDPTPAAINVLTPADLEFISLHQPINTNLLTGIDGRERVVSFNLTIAINKNEDDSEEFITLLERSQPVVRDIALNVVREKTFEELRARDSTSLLSSEILMKLQEEYQSNLIVNVLITDLFTP